MKRKVWVMIAMLATSTAAGLPSTNPGPLRGTWALTGGELAGKPLSAKLLGRHFRLTVGDDGQWDNVDDADPKPQRLRFTVDPTASPQQVNLIDPTDAHPEDQGELGIYKVEGDTLTVNLTRPGGKDRPTEFRSTDRNTMVRVYTRIKP